MDDQISWHAELAVAPGQGERFHALTGEMVAAARAEPGILSYQRFVSADGTLVHVYERYVSSAAAVAHLESFMARFSQRYSALVTRKRFTVCGHPSEALRTLLDGFGAIYMRPYGDFAYWA